jgi:hypothetical protein
MIMKRMFQRSDSPTKSNLGKVAKKISKRHRAKRGAYRTGEETDDLTVR